MSKAAFSWEHSKHQDANQEASYGTSQRGDHLLSRGALDPEKDLVRIDDGPQPSPRPARAWPNSWAVIMSGSAIAKATVELTSRMPVLVVMPSCLLMGWREKSRDSARTLRTLTF